MALEVVDLVLQGGFYRTHSFNVAEIHKDHPFGVSNGLCVTLFFIGMSIGYPWMVQIPASNMNHIPSSGLI